MVKSQRNGVGGVERCGTGWWRVPAGGWRVCLAGWVEKKFSLCQKKSVTLQILWRTQYIICNNEKSDRYGIGAVRREVELIKSE